MSSTIRDVAKRANVSAATVSLVLNGKPGISEKTRARVLQTATDLKYVLSPPSVVEGTMRTLRFLKIAKHGHTVNRDHNVFISDFIDGMSGEASELGYKLEVVSFEGAPITEITSSLASQNIDGAIVLGTELSEDDIQALQEVAIPFVVIDAYCDFLECSFVDMNNKDAVSKVVTFFVDCGFKDIGLISSRVPTMNFNLRISAFQEVTKRLGLTVNKKHVVMVDSTYQGAYDDMTRKLEEGLALPECFFCTNDIITYGCIKAFRDFDISIPRDLSIIGFDNLPMSSTMDPPLTTIDVSKQKIGDLAVRLLDQLIKSTGKQPAVKILVGTDLVVRESVIPRLKSSMIYR